VTKTPGWGKLARSPRVLGVPAPDERPKSRPPLRSPDALALFALLVFVAGRCLVPMDETDMFFNLKLGEIILESGKIPTENLLSFTYPEYRDVNLAWVFQVILAITHKLGGLSAR